MKQNTGLCLNDSIRHRSIAIKPEVHALYKQYQYQEYSKNNYFSLSSLVSDILLDHYKKKICTPKKTV